MHLQKLGTRPMGAPGRDGVCWGGGLNVMGFAGGPLDVVGMAGGMITLRLMWRQHQVSPLEVPFESSWTSKRNQRTFLSETFFLEVFRQKIFRNFSP